MNLKDVLPIDGYKTECVEEKISFDDIKTIPIKTIDLGDGLIAKYVLQVVDSPVMEKCVVLNIFTGSNGNFTLSQKIIISETYACINSIESITDKELILNVVKVVENDDENPPEKESTHENNDTEDEDECGCECEQSHDEEHKDAPLRVETPENQHDEPEDTSGYVMVEGTANGDDASESYKKFMEAKPLKNNITIKPELREKLKESLGTLKPVPKRKDDIAVSKEKATKEFLNNLKQINFEGQTKFDINDI